MTAFGDAAFAVILLVFGLVTIAAVPPGTTIFTGIPIVLAASQMVAGRKALWLPAKVGARAIPPGVLSAMDAKVLPRLKKVEKLLRPRPPSFFGPIGRRFVGLVCLLLGILIVSPLPFGNLLPGLAVAILAMALFRKDGVAALIGFGVAIVGVAVVVAIYGGLIMAALHWLRPGPPPFDGPPMGPPRG